jgi:hypothetical protein
MKGSQTKYHLRIDEKRTTVTVDTILSRMFAIKNKIDPFKAGGHTAVRDLIQVTIDKNKITKADGVSQTLRYIMVMQIAPTKLRDSYFKMSQADLNI